MPATVSGAMRRVVVCMLVIAGLFAGTASTAQALPSGSTDNAAKTIYKLLLEHTRWTNTQWEAGPESYEMDVDGDSNLCIPFGNAILLNKSFGTYDAGIAGVSESVLRERTLKSIKKWAASNVYANPSTGTWGGSVIWISTFESYFVAGAELMWSELDSTTKENVAKIIEGMADYDAELGVVEDPKTSWNSNGLLGVYKGNSRFEEMGAKFIPVAVGLANFPTHPNAAKWKKYLNLWALNQTGLRSADAANYAATEKIEAGEPTRTIADLTASKNVWDTYVVENHGSFAPIYQTSAASQSAHAIIHFLINERAVPQALTTQPNASELWRMLENVGTNAGVAADLAVDDRHHRWGINVLPLASRAVIQGDRYAARGEAMLLERFPAYVAHAPAHQFVKFDSGTDYEGESHSELATAFLLHYWRSTINPGLPGGELSPVSEKEYFEGRSGTWDHGAGLGIVAQQTPQSLAAAVTKKDWVKFAFQPQHDDWLFDISGKRPVLIPSSYATVESRKAHEYRRARDGFDATATLLKTKIGSVSGYAGFATLPNGQAVYATTGLGADEGELRVHNLTMEAEPGGVGQVPGLDGDRTFTGSTGAETFTANGEGNFDETIFTPVEAQYVKFRSPEAGFKIEALEIRNGSAGADLANAKTTTANSSETGFDKSQAVDGNAATAWMPGAKDAGCECNWIYVNLGSKKTFDRVKLNFGSTYATGYKIQHTNSPAGTWNDTAPQPKTKQFEGSGWLNVDGRAGFVVRGNAAPISVWQNTGTEAPVTMDTVWLSPGSPTGIGEMVVEARPGETPEATKAASEAAVPSGGPAWLEASVAGGYLSLFNLSESAINEAALTVPQGSPQKLYRGTQTTVASSNNTTYTTTLAAMDARVEAPRFLLTNLKAGFLPAGVKLTVTDSTSLKIENPPGSSIEVKVQTADGTKSENVTVASGASKTVTFSVPLTPAADLARTRITYPSSPLPAGMTDPDLAVDGDTTTTWEPGPGGRMVVDLGARHELTAVKLTWASGTKRAVTVETSDDGIVYGAASLAATAGGTTQQFNIHRSARFVAISIPAWTSGDAKLASFEVEGSAAEAPAAISNGDGDYDEVLFPPVKAEYVKFQGVKAGSKYGYTLEEFEVFGENSANLALEKPTEAISFEEGHPPADAVDKEDPVSSWSVDPKDRACECGWMWVNLGALKTIDRVKLNFDPAFATQYEILYKESAGGTWKTAAEAPVLSNGDGDVDEVKFPTVSSRAVRFQGLVPATEWGFTLEEFEVRKGMKGTNLALKGTAGNTYDASSTEEGTEDELAFDGLLGASSLWSVNPAERPCPDCPWLEVDFGSAKEFDRVRLDFDPAFGAKYEIQTWDSGTKKWVSRGRVG